MAEASDIGANFSEYTGNAGAFGGNFGAIEIDTRPLDNLAAYTFTVNKVKYDQAQKDAEANAKKLADLTAYDLNTAIPKDREIIQKGYDELYNFVRDNPTVLDYKNNQKGWMEYNKKKNDFENKLAGGKTRSILYSVREKEIADETNPEEKKRLQEELEKEVATSDLKTPLKYTNKYNLTPVEVKAPNMTTLDVTKEGQNVIAQRTYTLPDMSSVVSQAQAGELGLLKFSKDPNTSEYKAQHNAGTLEPVESAKNISSVILDEKYKQPQFRNEDGTLDIDAVIKDNEGNALVSGNLNAVKQYNAKMQQYKNGIRSGYFEDKFKAPITFGANGLNESNFAEIDISDGIQPRELLQMRIIGLAKGEGYNTKIIETDDANQQADREAANYRARLNEQGANFRAKLPYEKAKVGKVDENGNPLDFGNLIYGVKVTTPINISSSEGDKFKNVKIINGAVVNSEGKQVSYTGDIKLNQKSFDNSIVVEYNKYVGGAKVDAQGNVLATSSPTKLLVQNDKFVARFNNGEIEGIYTDNGSGEKGSLITVEQFKHITQQAALRGVTKYKQADVNYGTFNNENAPESKVQKSTYKVNGKSYSQSDLNNLGYTDEQIQEAIKLGNIKQ